MRKLTSFKDLAKTHKTFQSLLGLRQQPAPVADSAKRELLVCADTSCFVSHSRELLQNLQDEIRQAGLEDTVQASITGCFGFCVQGPIVRVYPDDVFYVKVQPSDAREIVESHLKQNKIVQRLLYVDHDESENPLPQASSMAFYKKQQRIALRNCGLIHPGKLEEYIANNGYLALAKCLETMTREETAAEMVASGLRGRGGGGFPTGIKWQAAARQVADQKYMVCNADEGDPGAFMDRSILEGDPHSVLEGMAIGAYAIGASQGYIYIRAEYPRAMERLRVAIEQAREAGLLGQHILGSDFSFDIDLRYGAGAFVCGEETALLHSVEGARGEPTTKPPFPAEKGLYGKPTIINNVETLANVPPIMFNGASWYSAIGTETQST
jgi:NADH-quinone oxidoreductase subunit F